MMTATPSVESKTSTPMKIKLESVSISDVDKALAFYVEVLGFVKKRDMPLGDARLVTVVSADEPDGAELLLEPNGEHPATRTYKRALYDEGIPLTAFLVDNVESEYARLKAQGVSFRAEPALCNGTMTAVLDDTCGNLIMIYQAAEEQ